MTTAKHSCRLTPAIAIAAAAVWIPCAAGQVYPPAPVYPAPVAAAPAAAVRLTPQQLDQLTAPIALYPDPLIAQVLPAATYPTEVLAAAQWMATNPNAPDPAIDSQPWESPVKALAHYPEVLQLMNGNPSWTQQLGAAYVNQPGDVMDSIQRLRAEAQTAGALYSTPQQVVQVQDGAICILPANPDIIYVPVFDPAVVFVHDHDHHDRRDVIHFGPEHHVGVWLNNDTDWKDHFVAADARWDHREHVEVAAPNRSPRPVERQPAAAPDRRPWTRNDKKPLTLPRERAEEARPAAERQAPEPPRAAPLPPRPEQRESAPARPAPQPQAIEPRREAPVPHAPPPAPEPRASEPPPRVAPAPHPEPPARPAPDGAGHVDGDGHEGGRDGGGRDGHD